MTKRKSIRDFVCERCGSRKSLWARKLTSGRYVCAKCYNDLPFGEGSNLVVDDMRTDLNPRRRMGKTVW